MNCANCGSDKSVTEVTPDMDIKPVALCQLCRMALWADDPTLFTRLGKRKNRK